MNFPLVPFFNKLRADREQRRIQEIVDDIDSIARSAINRSITLKDSNNAISRRNIENAFGNSKAIVGKLKKTMAPSREISSTGIYINNFNMSDLYTAYVGENLVKFSVDKYIEATIRNGAYIDSKNPLIVQYLNKRFKEFEVVSKCPTSELISDFMYSLITYGNSALVRYRNNKSSSGRPYVRWDGASLNPIASLYVEDFRKILIGEGPLGRIRYLRLPQNVDTMNINSINPSLFTLGKNDIIGSAIPLFNPIYNLMYGLYGDLSKLFKLSTNRLRDYLLYEEDDILHVRYHHVPGEKIAMPPFWPTLNDIDSLRRIEENIELLVYQYGHPLLHGLIGDEKKPGEQPEIDDLQKKLQGLEENGFIITDNRTLIKMVGAESQALRLEAYLTYFYRRVLTGLWLSEVAVGVGDTSNRSTANTLDKLSQEKVVELQNIFSASIQSVLIELLLEAGAEMSWILKPENIPSWKFNPVDIEGLIKKEAHTLTKWQAGMLTESEMRREIGREPITDAERNQTYTYLHQIPLALSKKSATETSTASASKKVTQQQLRPSNQHGTKSGPSQSQNA